MIFIKFKKGQGLGNQLWNYVTLRSIANFLSYDYRVLDFENFKGINFLDIDKTSNNTFKYDEKSLNNFYEDLFYDKDLKTISCNYDESIFKVKENTLLNGLFQSENYLKPNKLIIKDFIKIKKFRFNNNEDWENLCILNLRGGEYKRHKNLILPKSYWDNAIINIKKINPKVKFKIVTDDERYATNFLNQYEILRGDISTDFCNLTKAKYLIISNSSFSYFPINLEEKPKVVIAPLYWSRFGNKYNRWASPANCYEDFFWQDSKGKLISKLDIKNGLLSTLNEFKNYNIRSKIGPVKSNNEIIYFLKKSIKSILNKFFPTIF